MTQISLGLIGVGAFGTFITPHLTPFFNVTLYDPVAELSPLANRTDARIGTLAEAASCVLVVLAVPLAHVEATLCAIRPHLVPDALVMDVTSVKVKPTALMASLLPPDIAIIGLHPLFGPQSGKKGIAGLNIALCDVRGARGAEVQKFLEHKLGLRVHTVTPEQHDREMAYVQGLTHLVGRIVAEMTVPDLHLTTRTYDYLAHMVEMIRHDSEELFYTIARENPFSTEVTDAFFNGAERLKERLEKRK